MIFAVSRLLRIAAIVPVALSLAHAQEGKGKGKDDDKKWDVSKLDVAKLPPASKKENLTYEKDVLPLFKEACANCHGDRKQKGDLRLDTLEGVLKGGEHGKSVVPGEAAKSSLLFAAAQVNEEIAMPPKRGGGGPGGGEGRGGPGGGQRAKALTKEQVGVIRAWIEQGAK